MVYVEDMKDLISLALATALFLTAPLGAQSILLKETFDYSLTGQFPPAGWSVSIEDDPWSTGWVEPSTIGYTGLYLDGIDMAWHGDDRVQTTYHSNRLITPMLDFSAALEPWIQFDQAISRSYLLEIHQLGYSGDCDVEVSTDSGLTWTSVWSFPWSPNGERRDSAVSLSAYAGEPQVLVSFHYYGVSGSFLLGQLWSIDNVYVMDESFRDKLFLIGSCGQLESEINGFTLTPNSTVALLFSPTAGAEIYVHPRCGTLASSLGATTPMVVQVAQTNELGRIAFTGPQGIPAGACGGFVQLVDLGNCSLSNSVGL